jgi:hypothetical protein
MLNLKTIQKLYDFGALMVYEVIRFDELTFKTIIEMRTFSEETAKEKYEYFKRAGFKVTIGSYFVKFDEAYSK